MTKGPRDRTRWNFFGWFVFSYTPKTNMVHLKITCLEKENHLNQTFMFGFHVSFRGSTGSNQLMVHCWFGAEGGLDLWNPSFFGCFIFTWKCDAREPSRRMAKQFRLVKFVVVYPEKLPSRELTNPIPYRHS